MNTVIGYDRAGDLVKTAVKTDRSIREVAEEAGVMPADQLAEVLDPLQLTRGGVICRCARVDSATGRCPSDAPLVPPPPRA